MLDNAPWQSESAIALTHVVQRLTAANAGVMTGPGTNSYLLGDARSGYVVIDPGPLDDMHVQRLWDATHGHIHMVLCTHSHPDHSPAAALLQARCAQAGRYIPIWGLPSASTARAASAFTPDRVVGHAQWLAWPEGTEAGAGFGVYALHTPGHAANHVCFAWPEQSILLTGDHVLNGSTTVVDPPDGNMSDYINSLDMLSAYCTTHAIRYILPAHGRVLDGAVRAIAQLKAHRLKREAKIAAVMRAHSNSDVAHWLPLAYDDVDPQLWPVAMRSLLAHVERIQFLQNPAAPADSL